MRRPAIYRERGAGLDVTMTPMIDVVFLLLVFFLWTASFHVVEHLLPGNLSQHRGASSSPIEDPPPPEADFQDIVVRLLWRDGQPAWLLNDAPLASLEELGQRLKRIAAIKPDAPVVLHPDSEAPMGDVIDAYDVARLSGFSQVQFAASGG